MYILFVLRKEKKIEKSLEQKKKKNIFQLWKYVVGYR